MCRAAQPARAAGGSEADPGAARSRPPRRPLTVHMRSTLVNFTDSQTSITGQFPVVLGSYSARIARIIHSLGLIEHGRGYDFDRTSSAGASLLSVLPRTRLILCDRRAIIRVICEHHIHPAILRTSRHRRVRRDVLAVRGTRV